MIELLLYIGVFAVSAAMILKGADFLVDGAADIARKLKISPIIIGLTILGIGTSLPEFVVSLFAALSGNFGIAIGNILGSNIANIGFIIGLTAMVFPLVVHSRTLTYEFPFMLITSFLLVILANDSYIWQEETFSLDWIDGLVLVAILVLFIVYLARSVKASKDPKIAELEYKEKAKNKGWKDALLVTFGIALLIAGGRLFVYSGSGMARLFGLSETFIGLTIVALGTSIPELSTTLMAAWKKHADFAIGTVVGSNIFNVVTVLGITSIITTIPAESSAILVDGPIMLFFTLVFLFFANTQKRITRWEGFAFFMMYMGYIGYLLVTTLV